LSNALVPKIVAPFHAELRLRKPLLYPAELRARGLHDNVRSRRVPAKPWCCAS